MPKITQYTELNETPHDDDFIPIVDVSDTSMSPTGTTKRVKKSNLVTGGGGGASQLSDLSDVNTSTPTNRNVLIADGVDFESRPLVEADISDFGTYSTATGVENNADVTDAANVDAAGAVMNSDTSTAAMSFVVDEDDMLSNSATKVPTQQSVKAYVDANAGGGGTIGGATGATDNALIRADGTGGSTVQSSSATLDDSGNLTGSSVNVTYVRPNTGVSTGIQVKAGDSASATAGTLMLHGGIGTGQAGGDIDLKPGNGTTEGRVKLEDANSVNAVALDVSAITTDRTVTFPDSDVYLADIYTAVQTYDTDASAYSFVIDEDTMASNSATKVPTQQSVKAYVDANAGGGGGGAPYGATYTIGPGGDYATINAWFADTPAAGDILYIDGEHTISAAVTVTTSDITIVGKDIYSSVITINSSGSLTFSGDNITLKNFRVDVDTTGYYLSITGTRGVVDNVEFNSTQLAGGMFRPNGSYNIVRNCRFINTYTGSSNNDSVMKSGGAGNMFFNNYFYVPCTGQYAAAPIYIGTGQYQIFQGNYCDFHYVSAAQDHAFYVQGSADYSVVADNVFTFPSTGSDPIAVYIQGEGTTVTGNVIEGSQYYGIQLLGGQIVASNNRLRSPAAVGNGIYISSGSNNVVTGNRVSGFTVGIKTDSGCNNNVLAPNVIQGNATAITVGGTGDSTDGTNITS